MNKDEPFCVQDKESVVRAIIFIFIMLVSSLSYSYEHAGDVLKNCAADVRNGIDTMMMKSHCYGYISGVIDGVLVMQAASDNVLRYICFDGTISPEESSNTVISYLASHPNELANSARVTVIKALVLAYPCDK